VAGRPRLSNELKCRKDKGLTAQPATNLKGGDPVHRARMRNGPCAPLPPRGEERALQDVKEEGQGGQK